MPFSVNPFLQAIEAPPISEAMSWVVTKPGNRELINLCQAVPSYPPSPLLQDHVAKVALEPATSLYTDIGGMPELRDELAASMSADYRGAIEPADVLIAAGCNQAFCLAMMALAKPGDNVILPAPYYFNHQMWLSMQGVEVRTISCLNGSGALPSIEDAAALIDAHTRAIILVTPNNPTGAIYPAPLVGAFFDLARANHIALVIDETYKDFRSDHSPPHDLFQRTDWREGFVQLYSFSKVYALTGYRVGSIIAAPSFLAEIEKAMDCVAICAPHISQDAALFGLRSLSDWTAAKRDIMSERLRALRNAFARPDLRYELVSAGAYFAYVRHPFGAEPAKSVAQRLARDHQLLCLPGSMFGPAQEAFLRLAFANVEATLMPEIADRLQECQ